MSPKKVLYTNYSIISLLTLVAGLNVDSLITKANIYYRTPATGDASELTLDDVESLEVPTNIKVIIHGFTASYKHSSVLPLSNAYLASNFPNVLLADWSAAAGLDYPTSRKAVGKVAIYFGKILNDFLNKHQVERSQVHVIGHSLGAHIAGSIGQFFNGTLGRVTGLDPALPLFTPHADDSLHATAAQFVDVVHTDYPIFGDLTLRGTADFYPNFGHASQPGCNDFDLIGATKLIFEQYRCSHNRAVTLFAESIGSPSGFPAIPCSLNGIKLRSVNICLQHWNDVEANKVSLYEAIAQNSSDTQLVYMGEYVARSAVGPYYLKTFDAPPYGMGAYTKF